MRKADDPDEDDFAVSTTSVVRVLIPPTPATHPILTPPTQSRTNSILLVPIIPLLHASPRTTPRTRSIHLHLFPRPASHLPLLHLHLQPPHLTFTRSPVIHPITPNQMLGFPRVHTLADFSFAVEVCHADVKAVDVAGDDGQDEHDAIEDEVLVCAGYEHDGDGRENDVAEGYY
jgi:hypothetical protein